ncbi:MAG: hypothetical protein K2X50_02670 [Gammaproteobacteria bacterium]|nr:hypothetical protein [Gammaproteobacteria bacterium]
MKQRRQWSGDLEELWYMANRRLRTWEWAAKLGIIPLDKNYRNFKERLTKVRENLDNNAAKEMLKAFLNDVDLHLKGRLTNYLGKVEKINKGIVSGAVKKLLEDAKNKENDPIILIYLANAFHKIALSEKKDVTVSENLNSIKSDVEAMLYLFKDGNLGGALANLRTIIAQIEHLGFTGIDSAVTLAAVMYDQEIPPDMFDTLFAKARQLGSISGNDPIFLYLLDLREGAKYASLVKKYFPKDKLDKGNVAEVELDIAEIESLLTSSGQKLQHLAPEKIISEILPELENPIDKLIFIQDEIQMRADSLSKDPEGLILLRNEMRKIIRENPNDEEVKKWVLATPLDKGNDSEDEIDFPVSGEIELKLVGKNSLGTGLQDLTPELLVSEILPGIERPVMKLEYIQEQATLFFDSLSKDPKWLILLQNEMLKVIRESSKDEDVKKWILSSPREKNSLLDWNASRFLLDPRSKVQRELMNIYSGDNQMLLGLIFRDSGGGDPFKVNGPVDALKKILFGANTQINNMPIEDIKTYMIAHPEHAGYFLKERSGVLSGRDFRKELEGSYGIQGKAAKSGISTKEQIQRVQVSQSGSAEVRENKNEAMSESAGRSEGIELQEVQGKKRAEKEMPVKDIRDKLPEPTIPEVVPMETQEVQVAQSEESDNDKAFQIIKDIEDILEKNSNIDSGRRKEVAVQIGFFKNLIQNPGQAKKISSALDGIKKMLIDESADQAVRVSRVLTKDRYFKRRMDVNDITGSTAALDAIEKINEVLDQGTNLDVDRVKEIKTQIDFLYKVIKNRQWHEDDHAPLLESIEKEVSEAKISGGDLKK